MILPTPNLLNLPSLPNFPIFPNILNRPISRGSWVSKRFLILTAYDDFPQSSDSSSFPNLPVYRISRKYTQIFQSPEAPNLSKLPISGISQALNFPNLWLPMCSPCLRFTLLPQRNNFSRSPEPPVSPNLPNFPISRILRRSKRFSIFATYNDISESPESPNSPDLP